MEEKEQVVIEKKLKIDNERNELPSFLLDVLAKESNDFNFIELFKYIWSKKLQIIIVAFIFSVASIIYALSLPNIYKSQVLLMPNQSDNSSGALSSIAGQFGGLASLAGINLGGGDSSKTQYALQILQSRKFLFEFIEEENLKVTLMGVESWDAKTNEYIFDDNKYDNATKTWVRKVKYPYVPEPSFNETYISFIENNLIVTEDKETGMYKIAISHYSPFLAKQILDKLVIKLNSKIKNLDLSEAKKSILYLENELGNTAVAANKSMFYKLIEQQQQKLMLTKVRDEYVFKIVDPALVAEEKDSPKRAIIVIMLTFLGGLIPIMFYVIKFLLMDVKNKV